MLIVLGCSPVQVWANPVVNPLLGSDLVNLTVFANTYSTTGSNSAVWGNIFSGDVATTGASSQVSGNMSSVNASNTGGGGATVGGNISSGGATAIGAGSAVAGNITSSGAATLGANGQVGGNLVAGGATTTGVASAVGGSIQSGGAATIGAHATVTGKVESVDLLTVSTFGGTVGSASSLLVAPVDETWRAGLFAAKVKSAQLTSDTQAYLTSLGLGTALSTTMTTDMELYSGVYSAANWSTTAGTILTLDGQGLDNQTWIFNFTDYLVTGASTTIQLLNAGLGNNVFWNTGGYASLGATSLFQGNIFATAYISVGANTHVIGVGKSCGGIYSATSYVSTGAGSVIGGEGCAALEVPEPATLPLVLMGLASIGFAACRRKSRAVNGLVA